MVEVPVPRRLRLPARLELGEGVLPHRGQQPEPRLRPAQDADQVLVGQRREGVERLDPELVRRRHRRDRLESEAAGERPQPPEHRPLRVAEQLVAPVEQRPQRPLPRRQVRHRGARQREAPF